MAEVDSTRAPSDELFEPGRNAIAFCANCGAAVAGGSAYCGKCGTATAGSAATQIGERVASVVRSASADAARSATSLLADPVGGLEPTYRSLGESRARAVGAVRIVAFALLCVVGGWLQARKQLSALPFASPAGGDYLKGLLALLVPGAAMVVVSFGLRRALGRTAPIAADVFTVGVALLPLGLVAALAGLLGIGNFEVIIALVVVALCHLILVLFEGLTKIGGLSGRAGAAAVPALLLLSAWFTKVVIVALALR